MLFVLALFTLMVIVSCLFMNQIVRSEIAVSAYEMLARTEISVYSVFRELETSVFGIAVDLRDRLDSGQSPKQIETYMARLNHELNGSHERYARFISVGGLIRGDSVGGTPRTQPGEYKPEECPWYKAARAAGDRIAITGPYTDLRTGADVISLSRNLRGSNGEDYGVLALNLDTEALWENVSSLQ
jgi:hypothetical protein